MVEKNNVHNDNLILNNQMFFETSIKVRMNFTDPATAIQTIQSNSFSPLLTKADATFHLQNYLVRCLILSECKIFIIFKKNTSNP